LSKERASPGKSEPAGHFRTGSSSWLRHHHLDAVREAARSKAARRSVTGGGPNHRPRSTPMAESDSGRYGLMEVSTPRSADPEAAVQKRLQDSGPSLPRIGDHNGAPGSDEPLFESGDGSQYAVDLSKRVNDHDLGLVFGPGGSPCLPDKPHPQPSQPAPP